MNSTKVPENLVDATKKFEFDFEIAGFQKDGEIYTSAVDPKEVGEAKKTKIKDILESNVPKRYYLSDKELEDWEYMKGAKAEKRVAKNGHEYTFREGAIPFPDSVDEPARTILTSERSKNRSTHIIEDEDTGKLRKLTPKECERLNCFPDGWTNTETMSHSFRYFAMGNALVVGLIELMGEKLEQIIENE